MKKLGLLAVLLSACTGTYYPYSSSGPAYASQSTTTQSTSADGTVTTTSSETSTFEAYPAAQPAAYGPTEPPPPPPPAPEPPPPPMSAAPCTKKDTPDMCVALQVMFDVGAIIKHNENGSCRDNSRALNRYADSHARELDTFMNLDKTHSNKQLRKFQKRHEGNAAPIMGAAFALDQRCEGDEKLDRALRRVGFSGMIGNPAL